MDDLDDSDATTVSSDIEAVELRTEVEDDDRNPFKIYSSLSPDIAICPGGSVENCVAVCPGSSTRVYGACVQGCADRCGDDEQP